MSNLFSQRENILVGLVGDGLVTDARASEPKSSRASSSIQPAFPRRIKNGVNIRALIPLEFSSGGDIKIGAVDLSRFNLVLPRPIEVVGQDG